MILVTGGTGLLGNTIVRRLVELELSVRVLCRRENSLKSLARLPVDIAYGDLTNADSVRNAMDGCSGVIHSGALIHIGWQRLAESRRVNVDGTRHVVDACLDRKIRLIHVSTVDTLLAARDIDHPINEQSTDGLAKTRCSYVVSKTEAEALVTAAIPLGLDAIIVHPGLMFGPNDWKPSSAKMMLKLYRAPIATTPSGGGSFCDARDVAEAILRALKDGSTGRRFILGGENMRYAAFWKLILTAMDRRPPEVPLGMLYKPIGLAIDAAYRMPFLKVGDVNGGLLRLAELYHYYDSTRAEAELGYKRRPIRETIS